MKKCKHDECKRKADPNDNNLGYCNQCIQLPTKMCNFCGKQEGDKVLNYDRRGVEEQKEEDVEVEGVRNPYMLGLIIFIFIILAIMGIARVLHWVGV